MALIWKFCPIVNLKTGKNCRPRSEIASLGAVGSGSTLFTPAYPSKYIGSICYPLWCSINKLYQYLQQSKCVTFSRPLWRRRNYLCTVEALYRPAIASPMCGREYLLYFVDQSSYLVLLTEASFCVMDVLYSTPAMESQFSHMSLVVRKLVFGVSDQVRHKPGCTTTQDG